MSALSRVYVQHLLEQVKSLVLPRKLDRSEIGFPAVFPVEATRAIRQAQVGVTRTMLELSQNRLVAAAFLAERCDLLGQVLGARPAACRPSATSPSSSRLKKSSNRLLAARMNSQRRTGEVAVLVVGRLDAGSVEPAAPTIEVKPSAQQHQLAEHRFEGAAIVASEVGDRLAFGLQAAKQPDDFDVAATLALEPSARSAG